MLNLVLLYYPILSSYNYPFNAPQSFNKRVPLTCTFWHWFYLKDLDGKEEDGFLLPPFLQ